jgi:hypothetical protein
MGDDDLGNLCGGALNSIYGFHLRDFRKKSNYRCKMFLFIFNFTILFNIRKNAITYIGLCFGLYGKIYCARRTDSLSKIENISFLYFR